jgi:hypothetical protein
MQNLKDIEVQNTFSSQVTESENQDLLDYNLSLSFEERLLNHQRALDTINVLIQARKQIYGEFESSSETPA